MCTNLKHVVLVLAHFCFYPLISAICKTLKCAISQLTLRILASSQISIKLQPGPFALALCTSQMAWILGCHNDSGMALSHFLSLTQSNWSNNLVKHFHVLLSKIMWVIIPLKFKCPNQYLGPMHTKLKRIWCGIQFSCTFGQIRQFCVTDPNNRSWIEDLLISSFHRSANMWIFIYLKSSGVAL